MLSGMSVTPRPVAPPAASEEPLDDRMESVAIERVGRGRATASEDRVAREEPLEIRVAGAPLVATMRTPGHDAELALGFLLSERLVTSPADVVSIRHCDSVPAPEAEDNVVQVVLRAGVRLDLEGARRHFAATSSCGICGKTSIEGALREAPPLDDPARFPAAFFAPLPERLRDRQVVFDRTGGLHGAALFDPGGALLVAREDVGRHNAVDKVIGWAAGEGRLPLGGHALLVSGRISYEIVQKALAARVPVIAAVSAPSSLAVALAERANLALVGFLRGERMNVYGMRERVVAPRRRA